MAPSRISSGIPPQLPSQSEREATNTTSSPSDNARAESAIPASLRGLLRSRSPVRDPAHAARLLAELPPMRSVNEARECLAQLETAEALPTDNELHIDSETYRQLANSLQVQMRNLPEEPLHQPLLTHDEMTAFENLLDEVAGGHYSEVRKFADKYPMLGYLGTRRSIS
jgi:hypothetical protein